MKWFTEKQVKRAAKRGRKEALLCSIKHWEQLTTATEKQIQKRSGTNLICISCALCTRYDYLNNLTACKECGLNCLNLWGHVFYSFKDYQETPIRKNWIKWKRASKSMLRKIIKLYEKEYGEYEVNKCSGQNS